MIINDPEDLERMQADGRISIDDADEVRTFMTFLDDAGPNREHLAEAYAKHYPEDYAAADAAQKNTPNPTEGATP